MPGHGVLLRLLAGPVGTLLLLVDVSVTGALRPGYDAWREPISALSLGPGGDLARVVLLLYAGAVAVHGHALAEVMPRRAGPPGRWAARAVLATAATLLVVALCVMDETTYGPHGAEIARRTVAGDVHIVAGAVLALLLVVHCLLAAAALRRAGAPGWALGSGGCALVGLVAVLGYALATNIGGPVGLFERAATVVSGVHGALLTAWLLPATRAASPAGQAREAG